MVVWIPKKREIKRTDHLVGVVKKEIAASKDGTPASLLKAYQTIKRIGMMTNNAKKRA